MKKMRILITGNSGFIGRFLSEKLIDKGYAVLGLDIKQDKHAQGYLQCFKGDILSKRDVEKTADEVNLIIHLAAKHHDFGVSKEEFYKVNVEGTKNILDCASRKNIKKLIFVSSVAVYNDENMPVDESTELKPKNLYGKSKLEAEKLVKEWASRDPERSVIVVRPAVVFGPYNYANMYNLIDNIYKGRFFLVGKGNNIKSVAYVENLVDAIIFFIGKMQPGLNIFNYSDEPHMTTKEIVEIISKHLNKRVSNFRLPLRFVLTAASVIDLCAKLTGKNFPIQSFRIKKFAEDTFYKSNAIKETGFKPMVSLDEGFKNMVDWYLKKEVRG
ncbi:MAG: NAD(P)-dependent oxidoreductase [Candidatus Omnitrophica bacterium]|nr:NAD(P)-dependent oxidoreductase [Candidatus Omnitrophota bacterium]